MPLVFRGLHGIKAKEKTAKGFGIGRIEERTDNERGSRRQKMVIETAINFLTIAIIREASKWKRFSQTVCARKMLQ